MKKNTVLFVLVILLLNISYTQNKKDIKQIKNEFDKKDFPNTKNYPLKTLAYITPWNKEGYNYVEKYSNKFDIISPTWFELKPDEIDGGCKANTAVPPPGPLAEGARPMQLTPGKRSS